jgi:hypothetical protein
MPQSDDEVLQCLVPLKVVILTENAGAEQAPIAVAIRRAFHGATASGEVSEAYFATGEDLGVSVVNADFGGDVAVARQILDTARASALHTLVVAILLDTPKEEFAATLQQLDDETSSDEADGQLMLMPVVLRENLWGGAIQGLNYVALGEYALRPVYAAAHALACAWRLAGPQNEKLNLFISHAKLDGLPLAQSFRYQLGQLDGLKYFYDAVDIPPGSNWRKVLRKGVETSALVALRTNVYEERAWCVQEMDWAEDFGCPIVVVEARTHLVRTREFLPTGGSPCVHVPDGNLVRILQAAMREALRVRLFIRQISALESRGLLKSEETVRVPRSSLPTLGMRCQAEKVRRAKQDSSAAAVQQVLVPEKFREAHRQVAQTLVKGYFPDAWFGTPQDLINKHLATP